MASATFTYTILTGTISTAGSIKNWAQHSSVPAEQILEEAQLFIYQSLRASEMLESAAITIADDATRTALPTGFLDPYDLKLDGDSEGLNYVDAALLGRIVDEDDGTIMEGRPCRFTIFAESGTRYIQYDVRNDAGEALNGDLIYYKQPELLAETSNETNFLTDRFSTLLRRACLMFAYEHRKRPEFDGQVMLVQKAIADANLAADMARRGQIVR